MLQKHPPENDAYRSCNGHQYVTSCETVQYCPHYYSRYTIKQGTSSSRYSSMTILAWERGEFFCQEGHTWSIDHCLNRFKWEEWYKRAKAIYVLRCKYSAWMKYNVRCRTIDYETKLAHVILRYCPVRTSTGAQSFTTGLRYNRVCCTWISCFEVVGVV